MVKINIISGFLGAGKTTLIKKLLGGAFEGEKVILLENEYGEVGIDGGFMKDAGITVTELNAGCICCTLAGDFQAAIDELIDTYHPDRLLVEPTGVGKLSEIIAAIEKAKERHELDVHGCATVVDAGKCRMYMKNFGEFFADQVKYASTIIFSRTQNLSADRIAKSRAIIEECHPGVRVITTPWDELEPARILEVIESGAPIALEVEHHHHHDHDHEEEHEHHHHHDHDHEEEHEHHHHHDRDHEEEHEHHHDHDHEEEHEHHHHHDHDHEEEHEHHHHDHEHEHEHDHDHEHHVDEHGHCSCGHDHHHHHHDHEHGDHDADEIFDTIGMETANRYTEDEIRGMIAKLDDEEEYGLVLRAKGILQKPDGSWFQFDYVPGELQVRDGSADYTGRFAVIGTALEEGAIKALFHV